MPAITLEELLDDEIVVRARIQFHGDRTHRFAIVVDRHAARTAPARRLDDHGETDLSLRPVVEIFY